jgi:hypothetical protein
MIISSRKLSREPHSAQALSQRWRSNG